MSNDTNFPNIDRRVTEEKTGLITLQWYEFFKTLWKRTGGTQDIVSRLQPTGALTQYAGASIPTGWLPCDGAAISRTAYSDLFRAIGTTWGAGDGSTTFNVPDLRGRFALGASGSFALASTGGATTVTLVTANLPAHSHGVTDPGHTHVFTGTAHNHTITDPGHVHALQATGGGGSGLDNAFGAAPTANTASATTGITVNNATAGGTNASNTTGITTQNTGSGTAVDKMPPYGVIQWIIKT